MTSLPLSGGIPFAGEEDVGASTPNFATAPPHDSFGASQRTILGATMLWLVNQLENTVDNLAILLGARTNAFLSLALGLALTGVGVMMLVISAARYMHYESLRKRIHADIRRHISASRGNLRHPEVSDDHNGGGFRRRRSKSISQRQ